MSIEKPYQPTREEIKKAENMMTDEEKAMSKARFEEKEKEIIGKIKSGQIKSWGEEATGFEKEKIEDMKKNAPLFFIYRDNTLFKNHIPTILKKFTEMGRQVDTQNFPEGTQKEDIEKWYKENKGLLSQKAIVSDRTADIPYKMNDEIKYDLGARRVEDIDKLTSRVLAGILFGENAPKSDDGNIETSKRFMTTIIKNILKNPEQHPKEVQILSSSMGAHLYELDRERVEKATEEGVKDFEWTEEAREYVTTKIKEWLVESGLESQKIKVIPDEIRGELNIVPGNYFNSQQKEFLREIDKPDTWIITDRHTGIDNNESQTNVPMRSARVLKMPPGNFFDEAKNHNFISYSEEEIENEWDKVLKSEFGGEK